MKLGCFTQKEFFCYNNFTENNKNSHRKLFHESSCSAKTVFYNVVLLHLLSKYLKYPFTKFIFNKIAGIWTTCSNACNFADLQL